MTFPSFRSTVTPFIPGRRPADARFLYDATTGAPVGIQNSSSPGPDGIWTPVDLTAAQIASPTAAMLADLNAVYRLNVAPYTRYRSTGSALVNGETVITPSSLDGILFADQFASIQAAVDALPATGGMIVVNKDYTIAATVLSSKPNVHLWAPSWATVLTRDGSLATYMIQLTGAGSIIEGMAFDGNGAANILGQGEILVSGSNSKILNCSVVNTKNIGIGLAGVGSRASGNYVSGVAGAPITATGFGIWALNQQQVTIDHNFISASGLNAIAVNGSGSIVDANRCVNCYTYTGGGGGVVWYDNTGTPEGVVISNNTITGGGAAASGIEVGGDNVQVIGNTIDGVPGYGIILEGAANIGKSVIGNLIRNIGGGTPGSLDGISVSANVGSIMIVANRIIDNQATITMRDGIRVNAGSSGDILIVANVLAPNGQLAIVDQSNVVSQTVGLNQGVSNLIGTIASAASISVVTNPVISLTGSVGVGTMSVDPWAGRQINILPTGAVVFTAGATINNTFTTVAGIPTIGVFDGTKWWLK